jgi:DNA-binding transcriptional MerR regulator
VAPASGATKEAATAADGSPLPQKVFFRIGEVARLTGVQPYVLRFWESQFRGLRPKKSRSGQRLYRRQEVELVLRIRSLLWERRFTIAGAKALLERRGGLGTGAGSELAGPPQPAAAPNAAPGSTEGQSALLRARAEILAMREELGRFLGNDELG